jgi:hypothetical protein
MRLTPLRLIAAHVVNEAIDGTPKVQHRLLKDKIIEILVAIILSDKYDVLFIESAATRQVRFSADESDRRSDRPGQMSKRRA